MLGLTVVAGVLSACGGSTNDDADRASSEVTTVPATAASDPTPAPPTTEDTSMPSTSTHSSAASSMDSAPPTDSVDPLMSGDLARFLAAAEIGLDLDLRGTILSDPESYIVLGQVTCARFSEGASFEEVIVELGDDPGTSGAVAGAAVGVLCPEHAHLI